MKKIWPIKLIMKQSCTHCTDVSVNKVHRPSLTQSSWSSWSLWCAWCSWSSPIIVHSSSSTFLSIFLAIFTNITDISKLIFFIWSGSGSVSVGKTMLATAFKNHTVLLLKGTGHEISPVPVLFSESIPAVPLIDIPNYLRTWLRCRAIIRVEIKKLYFRAIIDASELKLSLFTGVSPP